MEHFLKACSVLTLFAFFACNSSQQSGSVDQPATEKSSDGGGAIQPTSTDPVSPPGSSH